MPRLLISWLLIIFIMPLSAAAQGNIPDHMTPELYGEDTTPGQTRVEDLIQKSRDRPYYDTHRGVESDLTKDANDTTEEDAQKEKLRQDMEGDVEMEDLHRLGRQGQEKTP